MRCGYLTGTRHMDSRQACIQENGTVDPEHTVSIVVGKRRLMMSLSTYVGAQEGSMYQCTKVLVNRPWERANGCCLAQDTCVPKLLQRKPCSQVWVAVHRLHWC
jgi:hypothetical protein